MRGGVQWCLLAAVVLVVCGGLTPTGPLVVAQVDEGKAGSPDATATPPPATNTESEEGAPTMTEEEALAEFEEVDGSGLLVKVLESGEACTTPLREGDAAHIMYAGMFKGNMIDYAGPDENGNGRGHVFRVGQGQALRGVEKALLGRCPGVRVQAIIPPELGFDDPSLRIKNKPVPDGAHLNYDIALIAYETPTWWRDAQRMAYALLEQVWPLLVAAALVAGIVYYRRLSRASKGSQRKQLIKRQIEKKKKK
ncbi:hypothetical protein PTSG_04022 [Salpingoeca rosetta]|uniref:peptidylprolyl isomerase n=1 Tax=Salpingoeca rosetta (strain ATCC 50818 / BSB-021) TaxID=946362 RepID=F2U7J7_SALR5|nr:uncharacterized protein PTSG_04022 [Salpingoeca rosetta]EGD83414.1 hypothetical protein PTSG_04022 [Salpingoeca rosetta]|eukprot:XP_004994918.1 hypothetical protein PTSG_04022 [Salpingoeca rosetta]